MRISLVYSKSEASLNYMRGSLKKQNSQEMYLWREVASVSANSLWSGPKSLQCSKAGLCLEHSVHFVSYPPHTGETSTLSDYKIYLDFRSFVWKKWDPCTKKNLPPRAASAANFGGRGKVGWGGKESGPETNLLPLFVLCAKDRGLTGRPELRWGDLLGCLGAKGRQKSCREACE